MQAYSHLRQLGRAKTTISRELRRNALPSGGYSPLHAAGAYMSRRRRAAVIEKDVRLQTFVVDRLAEGWSPEQIAGWLKSGVERGLRAIECETVYAFIYRAGQKAAELWRYLARRRKRRRPLRSRPARDLIKNRASIHERPTIVDARDEAGQRRSELPDLEPRSRRGRRDLRAAHRERHDRARIAHAAPIPN